MEKFSKTQIDKLGDRLRKGQISEEDLKLLDEYRKSYGQVYDEVIAVIKDKLKLSPTGRPAKSTGAIVEKLFREKIRLTQVQDISGCRIIVEGIHDQEKVLLQLKEVYPSAVISDRRKNPSHGYRAVHLIVKVSGKPFEVQIRTALQHGWAEYSEKLADKINPALKYGGGDEEVLSFLSETSNLIKDYENMEIDIEFFIENKSRMTTHRSQMINLLNYWKDSLR